MSGDNMTADRDALFRIHDILHPDSDPDSEWSADTMVAIADVVHERIPAPDDRIGPLRSAYSEILRVERSLPEDSDSAAAWNRPLLAAANGLTAFLADWHHGLHMPAPPALMRRLKGNLADLRTAGEDMQKERPLCTSEENGNQVIAHLDRIEEKLRGEP